MKRMCRDIPPSSRRHQRLAAALLRQARIVTDPEKLALLYAEAAKWKRYAEAERKGIKQDPVS